MHWVAPTQKDDANHALEKRLWDAADQFRANSGLKAAQYSAPVLGLIFLRFAEARFAQRRAQREKSGASSRRSTSRVDEPAAYHAEGVLFLTPNARFDYLLQRPEGSNVGRAVNEAMADIEKHNSQLAGVLPRNYQIFNGMRAQGRCVKRSPRIRSTPSLRGSDAVPRGRGEFAESGGGCTLSRPVAAHTRRMTQSLRRRPARRAASDRTVHRTRLANGVGDGGGGIPPLDP